MSVNNKINFQESKKSEHNLVNLACETLSIEANAILSLKKSLLNSQSQELIKCVNTLFNCSGKVIVTGVGKSGHIGRKFASTLSSTGTPAIFLHPSEAAHGDLGVIIKDDVVIAISNSGESDELISILPAIKRVGSIIISITGQLNSSLSKNSDINFDISVSKEACPLNLAPTASTTVCLALGDAIAISLLDMKSFKKEDFVRSHPSGSLGRKLLTYVKDIMRTGKNLPMVKPESNLSDALIEITLKGMAMTTIVDADLNLIGIFTDGDLRRLIEQRKNFSDLKILNVMHPNPHIIKPNQLAVDAVDLMEKYRINQVLVSDSSKKLIGAIHIHDLTRAKVI